MSVDASKIHMGQARVFVGGTNPTTGTPPTLAAHTAGVPSGAQSAFVDLGFTQGDTTFEIMVEKGQVKAEQSLATVALFTTGIAVKLRGTMLERNYTALKAAIDACISSVDDGSKTLFYGGGGTGVLAPATQGVMFTAIQPQAPTKYFVGVIYKAFTLKGFSLTFNKAKESVIPFELEGMTDSARNAGDELFQFFIEK
jgi:hypothetical protein